MRQFLYTSLLIGFILLLSFFVMSPALRGGFYFDDQLNLSQLALGGGINTFSDWIYFVFSGQSGPLGRPLSLASFTLNIQNWPAPAYELKLTNIIIHLINGLLVYFFIYQLQLQPRLQTDKININIVSIGSMALWLLHPLQLSTILPVIQRMTELSATFTLLGLIYYLKYREILLQEKIIQTLKFSSIIALLGLLSALAKENGILLPIYILVIEFCFYSNQSKQSEHIRYWKITVLYLPTLIIIGFLIHHAFLPPSDIREFTNIQRLITQPHILLTYLNILFIPQVHVSGIFNDHYPFFGSILDRNAFFSVMLICSSIILALILRRKLPLLSFALLWFYVGHLLESSSIALELYFEHRNYLPIIGFFFVIVFYFNKIPSKIIRYLSLTAIIFTLALVNYQNSILWSSPLTHSLAALQELPYSIRANETAAEEFLKQNKVIQARMHYLTLAEHYPKKIRYSLQAIYTDCLLKQDNAYIYHRLPSAIAQAKDFEFSAIIINKTSLLLTEKTCFFFTQKHLLLILALLEKQLISSEKAPHIINRELENIYVVKANILLRQNKPQQAISNFKQALQIKETYSVVSALARLYLNRGDKAEAKAILEHALNNQNNNKIALPRTKILQSLLNDIDNGQK